MSSQQNLLSEKVIAGWMLDNQARLGKQRVFSADCTIGMVWGAVKSMMSNISRGRLPSYSPRGCQYSSEYCGQFSLGIFWELEQRHVIFVNSFLKLLLPVCLRDFSAVERKDNIVCCLRFMLKLSRENKSAAAPIHARSNDSPCTRVDFSAKQISRFEDQKVHTVTALFINYFHQLAFSYFLEKIRSRWRWRNRIV